MAQSLTLTTPSAVVTRRKKFPKQGVYNLKITRNGVYDTVDLWIRKPTAATQTIQLDGAVFVSTQIVSNPKKAPINPTSITGTTFDIPAELNYIQIKLDEGVDVAYLRFSYTFKSSETLLSSGNPERSALIDYGKKPYVADNFWMMFANDPIRSDITNWDVSSVTSLVSMFENNIGFNQPIGKWDTSNINDMEKFLLGAAYFNQPISNWNVSKVFRMSWLFAGAASFNQPIGSWDISKVTDMHGMFFGATSFQQDLSPWAAKFHINVELGNFFSQTNWNKVHYDNFLIALALDINTTRAAAWATRTTPKVLGMGTSKYSAASATARASLVSNGWTITDGGLTA